MARQIIQTGARFGRLVCLGERRIGNHGSEYLFQCDCGKQRRMLASNVSAKRSRSCGCARYRIDLVGRQFGRLTVVARDARPGSFWFCRCTCGNIRSIGSVTLQSGNTRSCGCLKLDVCRARAATLWNNVKGEDRSDPRWVLWSGARKRAKERGLPFDLLKSDIVIPSTCPVLGIRLEPNVGKRTHHHNSPTLDRVIPEHGYVLSNVRVISHRANAIKRDASIDELERVIQYMRTNGAS